ncbi:DUF1127 domain-containing protein [Aliishimia ponticola]|uniref:DUF1127 domain-containing protein n=1 Tax=Aliishimia ponticola TaxID=2499833 RepID=A0A4S4NGE9_9RHOB|nr:DUF1127 domain-containing protein [Aliishimia ponticola]THH37211.1 DUF1127 domain-containing protein [Aliishimia ponticola]
MAAIDFSRAASGSATVANRRGSFFSALIGAIVSWNDARLTRNALNDLTDRELEDIGLTRSDIEDVAQRYS